MLRHLNIAPFHRVLMHILKLLAHYSLVFNALRMISLFPYLIFGFPLMPPFEQGEQMQQSFRLDLMQMRV
ncbi:MAG: hypothetical protein D3911_08085 [Candidatus Electrothrix sp. AW3_4]|nr:hypothetical protein [Candidatus Electrothrix gigas]